MTASFIAVTVSFFAALQLADSFMPTGMFTQSHGLERFVEQGAHGEQAIGALLHSYLLHVAAPGDALAARWVARAATQNDFDLLAQIDERLEATKFSSEGRLASRRCGGRLLLLAAEAFGGDHVREYARRVHAGRAHGHQAVALALAAHATGLDEHATVGVELHSFSVSLLSAAMRLGAIDHIACQRLLFQAGSVLAEAAAFGVERDWREIGGFAPAIEIAQMQHPWGDMHMFVS